MCGRFTLTISDIATLAAAWGAEVDEALRATWRPRYNVAPGQAHPVLREEGGRRRLVAASFGLPAQGGGRHLNARAETVGTRRAFAGLLRHARCAVPADGFYEWEGPPSARRPSWLHRADGSPLWLAAVSRAAEDGALSFAILTTAAVEPVQRLHDRMPVILPPAALEAWIATGPAPDVPAPVPGELSARPVSTRVNSPAHDGPECLEPPDAPPQLRLF